MISVGPVFNRSLLNLIALEKKISYEELKQKFLTPNEPGVIRGNSAMFDNDLKTLEKEGYIKINDEIIEYVRN